MKVTFLGTGTSTGVPVIACNCDVCRSGDPRDRRYRTSAMLTVGNTNIVIDCGPDFRNQMLKNKIENIDAVLFTHAHRDHIAGLDDIRAFNYILNKVVNIYGTNQTLESIKTQFPYIFFSGRYFGVPQITLNIIDDKHFIINGIEFTPIRVMHQDLPITGYRVGDFTYITDANHIDVSELDKVRGSKVIVLNALRNSRHVSHFSLSEALAVLEELKPERAYLTHISHFLGKQDEVEKKLPPFVRLAYDNLVIEV
jgi:phosphoribosyl 1,2-cyclic phosphate phosphodiesterase